MIFGIWLIALTITIPWAVYFQQVPITPERPDIMMCFELWPDEAWGTIYFVIANLILCYFMPFIIISICYILIWVKVSDDHFFRQSIFNNLDLGVTARYSW
jgi:neuropeptide FF receptor 2